MVSIDPVLSTTPFTGIAEPHESTVVDILHAVGQGWFTAAEADILIGRVRTHGTTPSIAQPLSTVDGSPVTVGGHASSELPPGSRRSL